MEAHALAKQCPYRLPFAVYRFTHSLHCLIQLTGTTAEKKCGKFLRLRRSRILTNVTYLIIEKEGLYITF